jgi:hypothetical protein
MERAARMLGGQRPFVLPDELYWPEPASAPLAAADFVVHGSCARRAGV